YRLCSAICMSLHFVLILHSFSLDLVFSFNDPSPTEIYTLSLHDALPICRNPCSSSIKSISCPSKSFELEKKYPMIGVLAKVWIRSEEHTSELQSRFDLVCRLLLEKKKYTMK